MAGAPGGEATGGSCWDWAPLLLLLLLLAGSTMTVAPPPLPPPSPGAGSLIQCAWRPPPPPLSRDPWTTAEPGWTPGTSRAALPDGVTSLMEVLRRRWRLPSSSSRAVNQSLLLLAASTTAQPEPDRGGGSRAAAVEQQPRPCAPAQLRRSTELDSWTGAPSSPGRAAPQVRGFGLGWGAAECSSRSLPPPCPAPRMVASASCIPRIPRGSQPGSQSVNPLPSLSQALYCVSLVRSKGQLPAQGWMERGVRVGNKGARTNPPPPKKRRTRHTPKCRTCKEGGKRPR